MICVFKMRPCMRSCTGAHACAHAPARRRVASARAHGRMGARVRVLGPAAGALPPLGRPSADASAAGCMPPLGARPYSTVQGGGSGEAPEEGEGGRSRKEEKSKANKNRTSASGMGKINRQTRNSSGMENPRPS